MTSGSILLLFGGGVVTGTIGAMLGIGGGVFLIPFLVIVFGLPMHQAIATSIVAVIATSSAGASVNLERHTVNMRLGMVLEMATVTGAIFGGITANYLSGMVLRRLFAGLLAVVAVVMVHRLRGKKAEDRPSMDGILPGSFVDGASGEQVSYTVRRLPGTLAVSWFAGNLSGLLGIGGGIFKVPAMHIISGIPMKAATATSNFMIGVTAAASAFIYFSHGHLNAVVGSTASIGVLLGSLLGVVINRKIRSSALTWIFAVMLVGMSIELFLR